MLIVFESSLCYFCKRNPDIDSQIDTNTDTYIGIVSHHHYFVMNEFELNFLFKSNSDIDSQKDTDTSADICSVSHCRYFLLNEFELSYFFLSFQKVSCHFKLE